MKHLNYLKIVNLVFAGLFAVGGLLVLLALIGLIVLGYMSGDWGSMVFGIAGAGVGLVMFVVFALLYFMASKKVADGRGRILQTILAVFQIGNAPVGTAYGAYALWVCWFNEETKAAFEENA